MESYKLIKPINFEGQEVTEIEYDFDSIKGRDIIKAEREVGITSGDVKAMLYASPEFQSVLFAKAAKKPVELIQDLHAPDFAEVTSLVAAFLMGAG